MERYAILVAGGSGTRMGAEMPKQFLPLPDGTPILVQTFRVFASLQDTKVIVVLPEAHLEKWQELMHQYGLGAHKSVGGGSSRTASVAAGMQLVPDKALVAIHDGVRPFVSIALIEACYSAARTDGAACAAIPSKDSLRERLPNGGSRAVRREDFYLVQTPQTFRAGWWKKAYIACNGSQAFTDDASMVEAAGYPITIVEGSYANIKITTPEDLR